MKRFFGDISPAKVTFSHSLFWIRIFNIPIKSMNKDVGARIANEMGELIMVDAPKSGFAWGPFLRIIVRIDITKPLMRGKMIQIENLDADWAVFKYERLHIFCYRCGLLGHQDRECPQLKTGCFAADEDDFQYGPWLRSMAPRGGRKKDAGIPHSMARDVDDEDVLSVSEEPEESQHIGRPAKELPMVDGIGNPAHLAATPGSITAVVARENLLSAVMQVDSNVRKDIAVPDSVLAFDSNSKLIIQDQIQDLDKAKISR